MQSCDMPEGLRGAPANLQSLIDRLTGHDLCLGNRPFSSPDAILEAVARLDFLRILGAEKDLKAEEIEALMRSILTGAVLAESPVAFLALANGVESALLVGTTRDRSSHLASMIHSGLGGPRPVRFDMRKEYLEFSSTACMTGRPGLSKKDESSQTKISMMDLLLDGLADRPGMYLIFATPEPSRNVMEEIVACRSLAEEIERRYLLLGEQPNVHRAALKAKELLNEELKHLEKGLGDGLWRVSVLAGSNNEGLSRQSLSAVAGVVSREERQSIQPLKTHCCGNEVSVQRPVNGNLLHSEELAAICRLPQRDRAGFSRSLKMRYDVDYPLSSEDRKGLSIGHIMDGGTVTSRMLTIQPSTLMKHALVCGHTGFGKSSTTRNMLTELHRLNIPFLVMEPAKCEYRSLVGNLANLCVFKVGSTTRQEIPFRFNPFFFPVGFSLHTHIDFLKQAFTASFGLIPPTPYLLEQAIYGVYEKLGWNLLTGTHPNGRDKLSFPVLSDLLEEIDRVVGIAGYAGEIVHNLKAALKTRLGNLCIGPKGQVLNTRENIPEEVLFNHPVILEFKYLGSDEEKAFFMGLILTRLFEYRESLPVPNTGEKQLKHLLVIEEAHRLLKKAPQRSGEEGNMAYRAVETFVNILAEVRAYGQGIMTIEQLPEKLASEVVKHSGTKIIHRLPATDDRNLVGDSMLLDDRQKQGLAVLGVGESVVHTEKMDHAIMVRINVPKSGSPADDSELSHRLLQVMDSDLVEGILAAERDMHLMMALKDSRIEQAAQRVVLAWISGLEIEKALDAFDDCIGHHLKEVDIKTEREDRLLIRQAFLRETLTKRALFYGWKETDLHLIMETTASPSTMPEVLRRAIPQQGSGHSRCSRCPSSCYFRYEAERLCADEHFKDEMGAIRKQESLRWSASIVTAAEDGLQSLFDWSGSVPLGLLYCAVGNYFEKMGVGQAAVTSLLAMVVNHAKAKGE